MAAEETKRNIRLGSFVVAGTILLILALYMIGSKQNLFGSTLEISARFRDVSGLMQGNNVRFAGINIGTVKSVEIESDTSVRVVMVIDQDVRQHIRRNAVAAVGTDGLMGNKLVNLSPGKGSAPVIEEGDQLQSLEAVEVDAMIRTLDITNENIRAISGNLRSITERFNRRNNLWNLLLDSVVADNVKASVVNLRAVTSKGIEITGDLSAFSNDLKGGKGVIGALVTDTVLGNKITHTIIRLEKFSDTAGVISGDLAAISRELKAGKGSLGVLMKDTMLVHDLNRSINRIDTAAGRFDENMEALQHTWPLKKYFRKKRRSGKPG